MVAIAEREKQLLQRKTALLNRLKMVEGELLSHNNQDWEELAVEREGDEVLEDLGVAGQQELRAIESALGRIQEGTYGICQTCGADIAEERLDTLPFTPFCATCAK